MGLANPFALLALAALAVPVAIHLWSRKTGRRVLLGTLRWLQAQPEVRARAIRFTEPLLLVVRCLLLACLALLLAKPFWEDVGQSATSERGIVLVAPGLQQLADKSTQVLLDSLKRAGHAVQQLEGPNYWRALEQMDATLTPGKPLFILADASAQHYAGPLPIVSSRVRWHTVQLRQTKRGIVGTYIGADSIWVLVGNANAEQLMIERIAISKKAVGKSVQIPGVWALQLQQEKAGNFSIRNEQTGDVQDVKPLLPANVCIAHAPNRTADVLYLVAGLQAAAGALGAAINITKLPLAEASSGIPQNTNVLVWLADAPLPVAFLKTELLVLQDGGDAALLPQPVAVPTTDGESCLMRYRQVKLTGAPMWVATDGQPALTVRRQNGALVYGFGARFVPQHTSLVESEALAQWLQQLLLQQGALQHITSGMDALDVRRLSSKQVAPIVQTKTEATSQQSEHSSLNWIFWGLVVALVILEALLARRRSA